MKNVFVFAMLLIIPFTVLKRKDWRPDGEPILYSACYDIYTEDPEMNITICASDEGDLNISQGQYLCGWYQEVNVHIPRENQADAQKYLHDILTRWEEDDK